MIVKLQQEIFLDSLITDNATDVVELHIRKYGNKYLVNFQRGSNDGSGYRMNNLAGGYGNSIDEALSEATRDYLKTK